NIENPADPVFRGGFVGLKDVTDIQQQGSIGLALTREGDLTLIQLAGPEPEILSAITLPGIHSRMAIRGERVYVPFSGHPYTGAGGITIVDLTSPESPYIL